MPLCCDWSPACTTALGLVHETKNSWLLKFAEMFRWRFRIWYCMLGIGTVPSRSRLRVLVDLLVCWL